MVLLDMETQHQQEGPDRVQVSPTRCSVKAGKSLQRDKPHRPRSREGGARGLC